MKRKELFRPQLKLWLILLSILCCSNLVAQSKITGKIVDAQSGETLPGVSVIIQGTNKGTSSDIEGKFSMDGTKPTDQLLITFVGYTDQKIEVGERTIIDIKLSASVETLTTSVVMGYTVQSKTSVTGSVSVLDNAKLKDIATPDVGSLLQGKASGVHVSNTSGRPGESANISIRGKGSVKSSVEPLWVVDGVVSGTGSQLNPNEIESISILKDASATALYGSRAANGVIVVTTKGGKLGVSKIDVNVRLGTASQSLDHFKLMNSQQLFDYHSKMIGSQATSAVLDHDTDWWELATQNSLMQNYTISHSVGTEKIKSFVSVDYFNEDGTVKGYDYQRFNVRSNLDYKFNDRLTLKTRVAGSYWKDFDQQHNLYNALTYMPWDYPYNTDGSIRTGKETGTDKWYSRDAPNSGNYLYNLQWNYLKSQEFGVNGTIGFEYKITDYLTFESNNNVGYRYRLAIDYVDPQSIAGQADKGRLENMNIFTKTTFANQMIRFNKSFDKHQVNSFAAFEYSDFSDNRNKSTGKGMISAKDKEVLDMTTAAKESKGTLKEWAMQSILFNVNYSYDNRYLAQFSYRRDGSSKFGVDNRYGNFYTFSGGWNIHNEAFFKNLEANWLNNVKLRASYGSVGNTPDEFYGHLSTYKVSAYTEGEASLQNNRLGNNNLTWEKTYETNVALDLRLLDRIGFSAEWYDKNTSDLLSYVKFSGITGFDGQWRNVGAVRNRGMEFSLNVDLIKGREVNWNIDFNIGFNKNKIEKMYEGKTERVGQVKNYTEGYDIDTWYMQEWAGVDANNGAPLWYKLDASGNKVTTSNYADAGYFYHGSASPDYFGGLMTNASWKGISLSASLSFAVGADLYHSSREYFDSDGAYTGFNAMVPKKGWSRWEKPGDIATHPLAKYGGNASSQKVSSRYIEDGSYLRIRNVTLSYQIPTNLVKKIGFGGASVYLSGENLYTFTGFSGVDPESSAPTRKRGKEGEQIITAGTADIYVYPVARRFTFGLNFNF